MLAFHHCTPRTVTSSNEARCSYSLSTADEWIGNDCPANLCGARRKIYFSPTHFNAFIWHGHNIRHAWWIARPCIFARAKRDRVKQQAGDLERWLQNELNKLKLNKKSSKRFGTCSKFRTIPALRWAATYHLYNFAKGDEFVDVENYYSENAETIRIQSAHAEHRLKMHKAIIQNTIKQNGFSNDWRTTAKTVEDIDYLECLPSKYNKLHPLILKKFAKS